MKKDNKICDVLGRRSNDQLGFNLNDILYSYQLQ